jgi:hypothetical protein
MANEITVRASLQIRKGGQTYQSQPTAYTADLEGAGYGPTPGLILAALAGSQVDFSQLTSFGHCFLRNMEDPTVLDPTVYWVDYGIYDQTLGKFYPLGRVRPGRITVLELSPYLQEQMGTGTGSAAGPDSTRLMLKAHGIAQSMSVEAFDE